MNYLGILTNDLQLRLTPQESHRLRQVSYERQLKAGHKHPGRSGLVPRHPSSYEDVAMTIVD